MFQRILYGCLAFTACISTPVLHAQSIVGRNLILNGGAESGPAGMPNSIVASIPGWIRTGNTNVLPYDLPAFVQRTDNGPAATDRGFNYFVGASASSTLMQDIDVSAAAPVIAAGNLKFSAVAWLGNISEANDSFAPRVSIAFRNSSGQTLSTVPVTALAYGAGRNGLNRREVIGLVPGETVRITISLTLPRQTAIIDNLSLIFTTLDNSPAVVIGRNLIGNSGAEDGPAAPLPKGGLYIPAWSTDQTTVCPYGGSGWIGLSSPGPANRGVSLFCSFGNGSQSYQDVDLSAASTLTDANRVTFNLSAWLGAIGNGLAPTLTYRFYDWSGNQVGTTGTLGPGSHPAAGLGVQEATGQVPAAAKRLRIILTFPNLSALADNLSFTLSAPDSPPAVAPSGILSASAFGGFTAIAPGSWIEIYGFNLANSTVEWSGSDFVNNVGPASLGGVSVSIGGKAAFLDYVSPSQINAQVASDTPTGTVGVTVTNSKGTSGSFSLTVNPTMPGLLAPIGFQANGRQYVAAILAGGGFALPAGAISGVVTRPARAGETVTIYGVGFGPVTSGVTAGTIVAEQNSLVSPIGFSVGSAPATASYYGLAPGFVGLYQFNVAIPSVASTDAAPISFTLGGVRGTQTLYIAVQN